MIKRVIKKLLRGDRDFAQISYSQCGEDLIIKFIFNSIGIKKPSYIDIGAHHPNYLNNTGIFYETGSVGINIEPDPALFKEFTKKRKRDININAGIANVEGALDFYIMSTTTLNTFSKEEAMNAEKEGFKIAGVQKIDVLPLQKIIKEHAGGQFPDFLTLDVEGLDLEILQAINYKETAPLVICVESISFSNTGDGIKNTVIIQYLEQQGYMLYADTYINSIFVKKDIWINRK